MLSIQDKLERIASFKALVSTLRGLAPAGRIATEVIQEALQTKPYLETMFRAAAITGGDVGMPVHIMQQQFSAMGLAPLMDEDLIMGQLPKNNRDTFIAWARLQIAAEQVALVLRADVPQHNHAGKAQRALLEWQNQLASELKGVLEGTEECPF